MKIFSSLTLTVFISFLSQIADAEPVLLDLHLQIVPRTAEETSRIEGVVRPTRDFSKAESFETNQAGGATVRPRDTSNAFSQASANISFERELDFKVGNGLFKKLWVSSPSSTLASDGLGPLYNARSCQRCHLKDGRGHPPEGPDDTAVSMLMRVSIPGGPGIAEIEDYL
ncbi:MAG: di-heme oxidoredictase family protein, partial [Pseudomonadota bacterium]